MASVSDLAIVAYDAGVTEVDMLTRMVAIGMAVSGGEERWHSGNRYGVWGITAADAAAGEQLYNLAANARAMAEQSAKGHDVSRWPEAGGGRFFLYVGPSQFAAEAVIAGRTARDLRQGATEIAGDLGGSITDGLGEIAASGRKISAWVSDRNNWVRVAKVVVGGVMLIVGVGMAAGGGSLVSAVTGPAGKALKAGGKLAGKAAGKVAS